MKCIKCNKKMNTGGFIYTVYKCNACGHTEMEK